MSARRGLIAVCANALLLAAGTVGGLAAVTAATLTVAVVAAWPASASAQGAAAPSRPAKAPVALGSPGKPVAPFTIEHEIDGIARIGTPLEISVVLRPQAQVRDLSLRMTAAEGLWIEPEHAQLTAVSAGPSVPAEWRIRVVPLADGVLNLSIYAEAVVDGARQGRSAVISITVDGERAPARATGPARGTPGGATRGEGDVEERVIRLPAEERR